MIPRVLVILLVFVATMWGLSQAFTLMSSPSDFGVLGGLAILAVILGAWLEVFDRGVRRAVREFRARRSNILDADDR